MLLSCTFAQEGQGFAAAKVTGFKLHADANGKYWFVDPEGHQFLSVGINNIVSQPFRPRPNTHFYDPVGNQFDRYDEWKQAVFKILQQHGFNTLGAWTDSQLYDGPVYGTICLYVAAHAEDRCLEGLRPGFEERVRENVNIALQRYPHLDTTFGVFLDNEMPWYGHGAWGDIPNYTLLEKALSMPEDDPARQAALTFLKQRYDSVRELSQAWKKPLDSWEALSFEYARSCISPQANQDRHAFIECAAEAFYETAVKTVRHMLPGKLILGTRFAAYAPEPVVRACGRHCDVISFNDYRPAPAADPEMLARYWIWGGNRPLMVTEFSWRSEENTSGNPNTGGAGAVVKTQAERAENYQTYVNDLLSYPMVVGAHWFEFADQSPQGRFDGENSNYGVVDIHHRPYTTLMNAMKQANEKLENIHAQSDRQAPDSLPTPRPVVFEPGQRPDRPPMVDLLKNPVKGPEVFEAPDANIQIKPQADHLGVNINTGEQWGCGILFFGPEQFKSSSGPVDTTNLDGYSAIELEASFDKTITFQLFLDEAGTDAPNVTSYDMSAGNDAESFLFPLTQGRQMRHSYRFELINLQARKDWGNQKGMRKVDIYAMKGIALYFPGGQGQDQLKIYSLRLAR